MKRMIKCFLIAFTAAALFNFSNCISTAANGSDYQENITHSHNVFEAIISFFPQDRSGAIIYPDFVGGIYYNENNIFVLQLVDKYTAIDEELYKRVQAFADETAGMIIEHVEFSQNELDSVMDALNTLYFADHRPEAFNNVNSFALDTINNNIEVQLIVYNEEEINRFKNTVLDSPLINLVEALEPAQAWGATLNQLSSTPHNNTLLTLLIISGIALFGFFAFLLYRHTLIASAMQTVNGDIIISKARVGRKQAIAAVKKSEVSPSRDLFSSIAEKIASEQKRI